MTSTSSVQVEESQRVDPGSLQILCVDTYVDESGFVELVFAPGMVSPNSVVLASVCETENEEPVAGGATLTVHDVTPMSDSLTVRIGLEPNWGRHIRLSLLIAN